MKKRILRRCCSVPRSERTWAPQARRSLVYYPLSLQYIRSALRTSRSVDHIIKHNHTHDLWVDFWDRLFFPNFNPKADRRSFHNILKNSSAHLPNGAVHSPGVVPLPKSQRALFEKTGLDPAVLRPQKGREEHNAVCPHGCRWTPEMDAEFGFYIASHAVVARDRIRKQPRHWYAGFLIPTNPVLLAGGFPSGGGKKNASGRSSGGSAGGGGVEQNQISYDLRWLYALAMS